MGTCWGIKGIKCSRMSGVSQKVMGGAKGVKGDIEVSHGVNGEVL